MSAKPLGSHSLVAVSVSILHTAMERLRSKSQRQRNRRFVLLKVHIVLRILLKSLVWRLRPLCAVVALVGDLVEIAGSFFA